MESTPSSGMVSETILVVLTLSLSFCRLSLNYRPSVTGWSPFRRPSSSYGVPIAPPITSRPPRPSYDPPSILPSKPSIIGLRPVNFNLLSPLSLLSTKLARILAIKRGILGGVLGLFPFRKPGQRPKPSYKPPPIVPQTTNRPRPDYGPPPPSPVVITTPRPVVTTQRPHPSYQAPGYYDPNPTTFSPYHSDVGAVIKVVGGHEGRFVNGNNSHGDKN